MLAQLWPSRLSTNGCRRTPWDETSCSLLNVPSQFSCQRVFEASARVPQSTCREAPSGTPEPQRGKEERKERMEGERERGWGGGGRWRRNRGRVSCKLPCTKFEEAAQLMREAAEILQPQSKRPRASQSKIKSTESKIRQTAHIRFANEKVSEQFSVFPRASSWQVVLIRLSPAVFFCHQVVQLMT